MIWKTVIFLQENSIHKLKLKSVGIQVMLGTADSFGETIGLEGNLSQIMETSNTTIRRNTGTREPLKA